VPRGVIPRKDDDDSHRTLVAAVVAETGAEAVVVGLPLSLDGSSGPAARWAEDEARELAAVLDVPVYLHDERLSSVEAGRHPEGGRGRRPALDPGAAAIMLQSWLDTRRQEVG
jgi:putative Holliday junction resolvase